MPPEIQSNGAVHFGREIDYLEDLGAKLRNLQGFTTLAHELLQNADDVPGVTEFAFNICKEALIVENNGKFSDCGRPEKPECEWKSGPSGGSHRCDFHRFRMVAGGDKRNEPDTTGAFGIGFISVYQITDRPELISGRHWILDETRPASERITQCSGCAACRGLSLPETRFILPWASDQASILRQKLRAEPTTAETPAQLLAELERSLPTAMLFLKKLTKVEVRQDGRLLRRFERVTEGDSILLTDGDSAKDMVWHLVRGSFTAKATELRQLHPNRIELKRSPEVILAIPASSMDSGLLCATLPTQQRTGLPFHINADFYPSEDRKRIISEHDYQSAWNRAALDAAASTLAGSLAKLREWLGHKHLWAFLDRLHQTSTDAEADRTDKAFGRFWKQLVPSLASAEIIYSQQNQWQKPSEILYLQQESERAALPVLESIGLSFVHEDLRPYQNLFTAAPIGVRTLTVQHLAEALNKNGLTEVYLKGAWPEFIRTPEVLRTLWIELDLLLSRRGGFQTVSRQAAQSLATLSLAVSRQGALCPCNSIYRAGNTPTENLFLHLDPTIDFASVETNAFPLFTTLSPAFGPSQAIEVIQKLGVAGFAAAVKAGSISVPSLVSWFVDHRTEILASSNLKRALSTLPIYPSAGVFQALASLSLPGNFTDPLQLAALLDVSILPKHHDFLRDLGIQELSFRVYVAQHLVPALRRTDLPDQKRRAAVLLIASRRSEFSEDEAIRKQLASLPLVECSTNQFYGAGAVYFPSQIVTDVLGSTALQAVIPTDHQTAFSELYHWLGVAENPRFENIEARVKALVATPPVPSSFTSIRTVFRHLTHRIPVGETTATLSDLRTIAWLPARNQTQRWFKPHELFAVFQDYLFESQANFLDIDRASQNGGTVFLNHLGITSAPTATQVVDHLLFCAGNNIPVNQEIYRFLNENHQDPAIAKLRNQRCLLLPDGTYAVPSAVFWSEHPFGRFRMQLGADLRRFNNLFQRLGIRETPTHEDAYKVLAEITESFGSRNAPLDDATYTVVIACWRMLESALEQKFSSAAEFSKLANVKCVPNTAHRLVLPSWIFFEDRAGLAAKFQGFLSANVIPRPIGASKAMAAAGVRTLVSAVEVELLECQHPIESVIVTQRMRERRLQLARVLEAQSLIGSHEEKLTVLDQVRFESADCLQVRYKLSAFGRTLTSKPETCPALFRAQGQLLSFVRTQDKLPWAHIARELALALYPDEEPGRIAPGLKEVLAADTVEEAIEILDQLGFAVWESANFTTTPDSTTVTTLGGTTDLPAEAQTIVLQTDSRPEMNPATTAAPPLDSGGPRPSEPQVGTDPTGTPRGTHETSPELAGNSGAPPRRRALGRGKLRSYVVKNPTTTDESHDSERQGRRDTVGAAGVAKVMEFERTLGCIPTEMPFFNEGYDIVSRDAAGNILRYIEVKSTSGLWGQDGVGLSYPQFVKAQELGDLCWLYVVENAEQPDARIYCIQSPASKVDQFLYDDGWQQAVVQDTRILRPPEDW